MALTSHPRDTILVRQNVRILVREGDRGPVLRELLTHNLVVASGLNHIRNMISYPEDDIAAQPVTPQYIAVGIGADAVVSTDTQLGTEVFRGEVTYRYPQTNGIEWRLFLSTADANGYDLTEVGLFSSHLVSSVVTLWGRSVYPPIEKTASVSVTYQWTWTFGNA